MLWNKGNNQQLKNYVLEARSFLPCERCGGSLSLV